MAELGRASVAELKMAGVVEEGMRVADSETGPGKAGVSVMVDVTITVRCDGNLTALFGKTRFEEALVSEIKVSGHSGRAVAPGM